MEIISNNWNINNVYKLIEVVIIWIVMIKLKFI